MKYLLKEHNEIPNSDKLLSVDICPIHVVVKRKDDCCPIFLFFELETSNFGYLLIGYFKIFFNCAKFQKYWTTFILDIYKGPPYEGLVDCKNKKHQRGTLIKCLMFVQSF